ncbi:hypothetical protein CCP3SC1AL1_3350002 [Gammaproteobacteria bacterium]
MSKLSIDFIIEYYDMFDKKIMEKQDIDGLYSNRVISYNLSSNDKYKDNRNKSVDDLTLFMYIKKAFESTGYSKEIF